MTLSDPEGWNVKRQRFPDDLHNYTPTVWARTTKLEGCISSGSDTSHPNGVGGGEQRPQNFWAPYWGRTAAKFSMVTHGRMGMFLWGSEMTRILRWAVFPKSLAPPTEARMVWPRATKFGTITYRDVLHAYIGMCYMPPS